MTNLLFNPSQASTEELEHTFVGRHDLLIRLEKNLLLDEQSHTPRHWQLIGPRGSGKSHLTELLTRRLRSNHNWRIARLPEENYQIGTLGELLEQIVVRAEHLSLVSPFRGTTDELQLQDRALDRLRQSLEICRRPLLVVLENLSAMFERQLRLSRDQARLRDILTNNPPFTLLATSTSQSDAVTRHSAPFYDFFQTLALEDLTPENITELVRARADWEQNVSLLANFDAVRGRVEAIYHLSGGNPRLALALYRVVQDGVTVELHEQVMKLLDEVTPYYQARLNDIPPQAARVLTEMAISETLATPAAIARRCRMPTNQITAQVRKLLDERLIVQGGRPDARRRFYEFKDRLLRIWIQMRESTGSAKRLRFLTEFFERWYAGCKSELEALSRRTVSSFWSDLAIGNERRCIDRLKTLGYLAEMKPGFDDSVVLEAMTEQVNTTSESDVRAHVEALKRTFERTADLRERETVAYLLAQCYLALDSEEESRSYLKVVIEEGTQSETIAYRYAWALVLAREFETAKAFGVEWLHRHPSDIYLSGPLGIAICACGDIKVGLDLVEQYIKEDVCPHCIEKTLKNAVTVLAKQMTPDLERSIWHRFLANETGVQASEAQIHSAMSILGDYVPSKMRATAFAEAVGAWKPLSAAPWWFLSGAVCNLAHLASHTELTLEVISAIAQLRPGSLSQPLVDHLVEILPRLRHTRHESDELARAYTKANVLIRTRITPEKLAAGFRFLAPAVAARSKDHVHDLLDMYAEWLLEGLIPEPITPYSETLTVLKAADPERELQSLHPETRDAVSLLFSVLRDGKPAERD